jgi:hypothetical protein
MLELWKRQGAVIVVDTEGWALLSARRVHKTQVRCDTTGIHITQAREFSKLCEKLQLTTDQAIDLSGDALKFFDVDVPKGY